MSAIQEQVARIKAEREAANAKRIQAAVAKAEKAWARNSKAFWDDLATNLPPASRSDKP